MAFDDAVYTINELSALIGAGVSGVKQVAHGTYTFSGNADATITTGITVNANKAVVLINNGIGGSIPSSLPSSGHYDTFLSVLTGISSTTITISANYAVYGGTNSMRAYGKISWQLIEFY